MVPAYLVDEHNHVLYVNVHECRRKNSSNSNCIIFNSSSDFSKPSSELKGFSHVAP